MKAKATGLSDEDRAKLEAKYPDGIAVVDTCLGTCAFRGPTRTEYKRFTALVSQPEKRGDAIDWFACTTVIYPDAQAFAALLERKPGIATDCVGEITKLAGVTVGEQEKF